MEPASVGGLAATHASVERTQTVFNAITAVAIALAVILCIMLIVVINRAWHHQAAARLVAEEGQTRTSAALVEANAASQLKDEFLATVSHELRNPLAPILTWTQLLRSGTLGPEKTERGLEVIERNVASLSELIDDLVDVSRVVAGKFRLDVRPVDLLPVIRAAVESQRPASDAKQIRLRMVLDERAGMVSGDSERIQQVMANLLSNAIKFTPKGGSVQVTLGRAESHVEIAVSDTGIGMEPAFLPHVFEPFQQAVDGTMRRHGGLGLGLSIVHHIVELHGGGDHGCERRPGKGFPVHDRAAPAGHERGDRRTAAAAPDGRRRGRGARAAAARSRAGPDRGRRAERERGPAGPARLLRCRGAGGRLRGTSAPGARPLEARRADLGHRDAR
jgi:signal transduction histidine kinase